MAEGEVVTRIAQHTSPLMSQKEVTATQKSQGPAEALLLSSDLESWDGHFRPPWPAKQGLGSPSPAGPARLSGLYDQHPTP